MPGRVSGVRAAGAVKLLTPLRDNRDFRMLWVGRGASFLGSEFTRVAVPFQVYRITGSSLAVGLVALAELVPLLVFSMVGGVLADSRDRRQILIRCHVGLAVVSGLFALNASLDRPRLWALFVLAAAAAALSSLSVPAVTALVPRLVPTEQFPAAAALQAAYANLGFILGPPLAGVVIASLGLSAAYLIDMASFLLAIGTLVAMRTTGAAGGADRVSLRAVAEGFRFLRGRPVLQGTYLLDFDAMVFGMPTALFPALVVTRFHGSARVLGLLYAAPAAGAA
jgi:MFS family permease